MKTSETIGKIASALLKSQKEMGAVTKDSKNPYFKSKYADINSMLDVAIPVLNANGIFVTQPANSDGVNNFVETVLTHESGEFIASGPLKLEPPKDMQQLGAAITYARRFSLQSLLGLRAEDDDGETAVGRGNTLKPVKTETVAINAKEELRQDTKTETPTPAVAAEVKPEPFKKGGFKKPGQAPIPSKGDDF